MEQIMNNKRSGKFYRQNEKEIMKRLGLKPTKGSGSGWIEKEDGQNEYLIAQLKSTDAQSMSVKLLDLHTLEYNADITHKIPLFVIQFLSTGELFVMARPADLPSVAEYLECGKCEVTNAVIPEEFLEGDRVRLSEAPKKVIKSSNPSNRENFYVKQFKK
jgi:hypothetical protein